MSTERWWLIVGWLLPTGAARLHAHISPAAATMLSRRSRTGSATTLNAAASSSASASPSGAPSTGPQQLVIALTSIGTSGCAAGCHIDNRRYEDYTSTIIDSTSIDA